MKPERLIISGWGPYKNREEVDFTAFEGKGLFLITGATGAGKTTIFDAITYALYGALSGEMREKNSVRSDFADAETKTFVELFLTHGGKKYRIVRNPEYTRPRKRGGGETKERENAALYGEDGSVVAGVKEVNAKMQEILALDYAQFKQITMIAQGEFARLLTAPPREKTKIFRDIFGTGVCEQFTRLLREQANDLYARVAEHRHKMEEDVKLLFSGEESAVLDALAGLTQKDSWNYDAVGQELARLLREAKKREEQAAEESGRLQQKNEELTAAVREAELQNEQIDKLLASQKKLEELEGQAETVREKETLLRDARRAGEIEPVRLRAETACRELDDRKSRERREREALERQRRERKELACFVENAALFARYLEADAGLCEMREKRRQEERALKKLSEREARERDAFLSSEAAREEKRAAYEEADKTYRRAVVGVAARMLKEGEPCPVCGSLQHPSPAHAGEGIPSEAELAALKAAYEKAEDAMRKAQQQAVETGAEKKTCERRLAELLEEIACLERESGELTSRLQAYADEAFFLKENGEKAAYVQNRMQEAARLDGQIEASAERVSSLGREIASAEVERAALRETWEKACADAGFASEEEFERVKRSPEETTALSEEIASYREKLTQERSVYGHLKETVGDRRRQDLTKRYEELAACRQSLAEKQKRQTAAHALFAQIKKTKEQFFEKQAAVAALSEEYGYVKDLDNLASGNNARRLVFEQYVLSGYFEEILRAANLRLMKMTGGRYEMSRVEEAGDGRVKDSLEIQVFDYYTGKHRSVKTLSGGESFKASLSLALGMSDVIQAMSGGIRVDTLFIDEGFGALDAESLDQACNTLKSLVKHEKLIGIISHVPELSERIDSRIVIEKTNAGSRIAG